MGTKFKLVSIVVSILFGVSLANAQIIDARVKNVSGSNCNLNNVGVTFSPDFQSVSLLYDEFQLAVSGSSIQGQATCNVTVEFDIDSNYTLNIFGIDVRGFHTPTTLATTTLTVGHGVNTSIGNGRGLNLARRLPTNQSEFVVSSRVGNPALQSVCLPEQGLSRLSFSVNLKLFTQKTRPGNILTVIDSSDYSGKAQVKYASRVVRSNRPCR